MWPFTSSTTYKRLPLFGSIKPRRCFSFSFLRIAVVVIVLSLFLFLSVFDIQLAIRIYARNWISHTEENYKKPHSSCFDNSIDSRYRDGYDYTNDISPGAGLLEGLDCYDYAGTLQPSTTIPSLPMIYHSYWRADLAVFGTKQVATLRSLFATQSNTTVLHLWSNGDLSEIPIFQNILAKVGSRIVLHTVNILELTKDTPMENSFYTGFLDNTAYLDGDMIRLLLLYKYGGMWFDMDSLFIRDMSPLMEHEWLTAWDCYLPGVYPFNGAFMHFFKRSPYLCEILYEMATGPKPRSNSIDWGGHLYYLIYRRLVYHRIRPWLVLPWCFTDSSSCKPENSMPNAFVETGFSKKRLGQTFAFHWHNQWEKEEGSLFRYIDTINKNITQW
ncbi:hypothetical protein BDF14DRAFT_1737573 [Spinellus fusiger]|nr:hypothetical protein BDF14DRAFT_1737573 [Spinellus fusiger]